MKYLISHAPHHRLIINAPQYRQPKQAFAGQSICSGLQSALKRAFSKRQQAKCTAIRAYTRKRRTIGATSILSGRVHATKRGSAARKRSLWITGGSMDLLSKSLA